MDLDLYRSLILIFLITNTVLLGWIGSTLTRMVRAQSRMHLQQLEDRMAKERKERVENDPH